MYLRFKLSRRIETNQIGMQIGLQRNALWYIQTREVLVHLLDSDNFPDRSEI